MTDSKEKKYERPKAVLKTKQSKSWMVPMAVAILLIYFSVDAWLSKGQTIHITFEHGHGLKAGDALRLRGIQVGEVKQVTLNRELNQVLVEIQLMKSAHLIAKEGSLFWIVRPTIRLDQVDGIETLVGARYLKVMPGEGDPSLSFKGLESEPSQFDAREGDIEILLQSEFKQGLAKGAPLVYRDIVIGKIVSLALSSDSSHVEILVRVRSSYVNLIRENSRFWHVSAMRFQASLTQGFSMKLDSLASLLKGGIAVSTPSQPGKRVLPGHRFNLAQEAKKEWIHATPSISVGTHGLGEQARLPKLFAATGTKGGKYFWSSNKQHRTWVMPIENGFLGMKTVFVPDPDKEATLSELVVAGKQYKLSQRAVKQDQKLLYFSTSSEMKESWSWNQIRRMDEIENCLIVAGEGYQPVPLSAARMKKANDRIEIKLKNSISVDLIGAAVMATKDAKVVGILLKDKKIFYIHPIPR